MRRRLRYSTDFASVFTGNISPHSSGVNGPQDGDQGCKAPPTLREDQVHDHLRNPNVDKTMGTDEMNARVLRQSGEVPGDWKKGNIAPMFKKGTKEDSGNH